MRSKPLILLLVISMLDTNRGDSAVSQVYVYYKNASGDLLLGGITYRVGLTDLGPGETQSCYAGHFSDGSRLLFVTYAP